jgi:uncharacterized protein RhaS with RHS repeats
MRDYDPLSGKYVESDPLGLAAGVNTYAYAIGNPVSFVDSMGTAYELPVLEQIIGEIAEATHVGAFSTLGVGAAFFGGVAIGTGINAGLGAGLSRYYGTPTSLGTWIYDLRHPISSPAPTPAACK